MKSKSRPARAQFSRRQPLPASTRATGARTNSGVALPRWAQAALIVSCGIPIFAYFFTWRFGYTSDHAMSGLLANDIVLRHQHPLFIWSHGYNGVLLESHAIALMFELFGHGMWQYYLPTLLCFIALTTLFYRHVAFRYGAAGAALSTLFFVVSTPRLYFYVMRPQPNYTEIFVLGLLLTGCATQWMTTAFAFDAISERRLRHLSLFIGLLTGFSLYTYQLILFFIGAIGLWASVPYLATLPERERRLTGFARNAFRTAVATGAAGVLVWVLLALAFFAFDVDAATMRPVALVASAAIVVGVAAELTLAWARPLARRAACAGLFVAGFVIGFSPRLIYSFVLHGATRDRLKVVATRSQVLDSFWLLVEAHGRFLNAWESPWDCALGAGKAALIAIFLWQTLRALWAVIRRQGGYEALFRTSPLALLPFVTVPLFCFAAAAEDWKSARWTIAILFFYALGQAVVLVRWAGRGGWHARAAIACAGVIVAHNALHLAQALQAPDAQAYCGEELVVELDRRGISRAYGEYWYAYAITFATNERIVVEPIFNHYSPTYGPLVAAAERIALIDRAGPRLRSWPDLTRIGMHVYRRVDAFIGREAGFVVLERTSLALPGRER